MINVRPISLILVLVLGAMNIEAGELRSGREMVSGILDDRSTLLVNGFVRGLRGEMIDYHSAITSARRALLTRTTDGSMVIEWQTVPFPSTDAPSITVFWLAALAGSKGIHRFSMTVNGTSWCEFSSPRDRTMDSWTIPLSEGGSFSFAAFEVDRFGDYFGYSFLRIPASRFAAGQPLTVTITGEAEGSSCWYMTFEHPMQESAGGKGIPCLVRDGGKIRRLVEISLEHFGLSQSFDVSIESGQPHRQMLDWGEATILVPVDTSSRVQHLPVTVRSGQTVLHEFTVTAQPVRRREIWLLPHSHNDIGYSDIQTEVERKQIRYLEEAVEIAARSSGYPAGSQFRWNIEILWPLDSFLRSATDEKKREVLDAIRRGWIGINGLYADELTGLCRPEELYHLTAFARALSASNGIAVRSAMISDIPSYTSNIVTTLAQSGIRYLSSGPNYSPGIPDGGDRIGHALHAWGDRPFYWISQSGESRVLFWMAGTGYSFFHGWLMGHLPGSDPGPIYAYLNRLDSTNYPYDMVQMRYTIDGDNGPPDSELADFVRQWNGSHASPTFHIATTDELFEEFERRYGSVIPELKGDLTPIWEDGAASTARELAQNRSTAERLVQDEVLFSMLRPSQYPASDFAAAWRNVVLFDEHTWGASNSVTEPDSPNVAAQWAYKSDMVRASSALANELHRRALGTPDSSPGPVRSLTVLNTNSWPGTDIVIIPARIPVAGRRVTDERGRKLASQVLRDGTFAVLVHDVPPLGMKKLIFSPGSPYMPSHPVSTRGNVLLGDQLRAQISRKDGSVEQLGAGGNSGTDLVDRSRGSGLNEYLYVPGRDPAMALRDTGVTISQGDHGPLVASLLVASAPAGSNSFEREFRIIAGLGRLDITNRIDKRKVREKESLHFGFPFLIPEGQMRIDEGCEVIRPNLDQLPGANRDYFSAQRWVDVSNSTRGITWSTIDAPLVEVGEMTNEKPGPSGYRVWRDSIEPAQNLYSYAMNNYWHTNYRADQEGTAEFRYSIMPHGSFDRAVATRFGVERSQPLVLGPGTLFRSHGAPLFTVTPSSVIVTTVVPLPDGRGWSVHLLNAGGSPADARLAWSEPVRAYESTLRHDTKREIVGTIEIPPSGVRILDVEKR